MQTDDEREMRPIESKTFENNPQILTARASSSLVGACKEQPPDVSIYKQWGKGES